MEHEKSVRLTDFSHGGGCACKIAPSALEALLPDIAAAARGIVQPRHPLIVGVETGDDGAVVSVSDETDLVFTTDFFSPVVDDAYDWGQIAAANALSDIYAMGGIPVVALNILGWPVDLLPLELAQEVIRGGLDKVSEANVFLAGGHSIDLPEPIYGLAVTGFAARGQLLRNSSALVGLPVTLTKPLGVGVLNNRHKKTGEQFPEALASMKELNRDARDAAIAHGATCATDVTGFGLLGHAFKMARASNVSITIDAAAVPYLDGARESAELGYVSGGTKRNLKWVKPHCDLTNATSVEALLLADAQTSGGLLIVGEIPGYPVIGETVPFHDSYLSVR